MTGYENMGVSMKLLNRKKAKMDLDEVYRNSLKGKQIPILILDSGWHELFPNHRKNHEIKELEKTLNRLIKKQGIIIYQFMM